MSIEINLGIAVLSPGFPKVDQLAKYIASEVSGPFHSASAGDVILNPYIANHFFGPDYAGAVTADQMHTALEVVTGRQRRKQKVTNIGLLIADTYYARSDFFGLMFDEDFLPSSSNPGQTTPREGCAIFLDGIAQRRSGSAFVEEAIFTAIHEIGHVFNLQHSYPNSFMAESANYPSPFPLNKTNFNEMECELLSQCSVSRYVWPGGSQFGDLGPLAPGATVGTTPSSASAPLHLRITVDRNEFWLFEPIELDVELAMTVDSIGKTMRVTDTIDPGYDNFVIWIEEPNGERRRYRSPRHYCPRTNRLTISRNKPFRRDISIFGEAGQFTFRKIGQHRVYVTFGTGKTTLVSNVLNLNVLPPRHGDAFYVASETLLRDHDLSQLLYHRQLTISRIRKVHRLNDFCNRYPDEATTIYMRYGMGRAFAKLARDAARCGYPSDVYARFASENLRVAVTSSGLGDHRRIHAERDLERSGRPTF